MQIMRAQPDDAAKLTKIAFVAKRHWGYPEKWMQHWSESLTIRQDFISSNETYSAIIDGQPVGFYGLSSDGGQLWLEHLWVLPEAMGRGVGRALFVHALKRARALGFQSLEIESDPNAEGFYQRMGARRVGANVTEMDGRRRELPVLVYEIDHAIALVRFGYLADHQDFIPTLARWHHNEWAYLRPGDSVQARISKLVGFCGHQEIPTAVIAFTDNTLLGSAMLIAHDMDTRMELSPWLAGVFVAPDQRGRGIGVALVRRVIEDATALGVRRLYLYTPSAENFYSRLDWSLVERTNYRGADVAVMSYDC